MADNYVDLYIDDKEGIEIRGKEVIYLNAPELIPSADTPLLTEAQDIVGAINELFQQGTGGGGYNGNFRAVIDDDTQSITIVVGEIPEGEEEEQYTDYNYTYEKVEFVEKIKTTTVSGDTTTTTEQTFTKTIITKLYNAFGKLIMRTDYDSDTGEIKGFYDADNASVYIAEWRV